MSDYTNSLAYVADSQCRNAGKVSETSELEVPKKHRALTLGSLFDGIGGWPLAAVRYGVEPIWASEVESFAIAVTKYHFPNMRHLGDIRRIDGERIAPVDILCAGSPCQNLSCAGNRQGLAGAESSLFHEAIRILREMRSATDGKYPRYFVWENVPGAFSSNRGHDFRTVLEEIAEAEIPMPSSGKWAASGMVRGEHREIAWVTKDAQYFGVPQRRKRIFLVASFGAKCAGEILFDEEGLPRNFAEGDGDGEGIAIGVERGFIGAGGDASLRGLTGERGSDRKTDIAFRCWGGGIIKSLFEKGDRLGQSSSTVHAYSDKASTLRAGAGAPKHLADIKGRLVCATHRGMLDCKGSETIWNGTGEVSDFVREAEIHSALPVTRNEGMPHLANGKSAVGCLMANCATKQWLGNQEAFSGDYHIIRNKTVRRLTPLECERLQGLPDGYTNVEMDGKPPKDSARYKALGNGMAQPCPDFVIRRIVEVTLGDFMVADDQS